MDKSEICYEKVKLRNQIRYKKRTLSKLICVPEALEEVLILKSEIESLELELENFD